MYSRQNAAPARHTKQIPLSARIGRSGMGTGTPRRVAPIERQFLMAETTSSVGGLGVGLPSPMVSTSSSPEINYWGQGRTARPARKQVNIWESWQQQRQKESGHSGAPQQQLSSASKPSQGLSLSDAERCTFLGGVPRVDTVDHKAPQKGEGADEDNNSTLRTAFPSASASASPTSPTPQEQQQAFNASYDSFVPEIHRGALGYHPNHNNNSAIPVSPSDSNPAWVGRAEMLLRRRETQQFTGVLISSQSNRPTPHPSSSGILEGTGASSGKSMDDVSKNYSSHHTVHNNNNNNSIFSSSFQSPSYNSNTTNNNNNSSSNLMGNTNNSLLNNTNANNNNNNNSRFDDTNHGNEEDDDGLREFELPPGAAAAAAAGGGALPRRRRNRSSVMDTITIVDELPASFRDGGAAEEAGAGNRHSRHSHRSGSGLMSGSGGQRWMLQAADIVGGGAGRNKDKESSFDGLDLDILSDLNATLSGTRHSTFERTRSLDGTLHGRGGTPGLGGTRSPSVLDGTLNGTLNTTLSSTLRGTLTNFNDTLGRRERAEMIAEELRRLEVEGGGGGEGLLPPDGGGVVDGGGPPVPSSYPAASEVRQGMEGLKVAVRIAEALTAEYESTAQMNHPMARERLELPPPRTQAAIARLFPHKPPAPLDVSVGVEALSLQSLRRRFGPCTTLARDADEDEDEEDEEGSDQLSVCSAARSLFHERAPSDCQSRMAVSRLETASLSSSLGRLSNLGLSPTTAGRRNNKRNAKQQQHSPTRRPLYKVPSPVLGSPKSRRRREQEQQQQRRALLTSQASRRGRSTKTDRSGPRTDTDVKGARVLKKSAAALLSRAMREREQKLLLHLQEQPERSKLLTMVRQWCDRTRLEKSETTGMVCEDPAAAHLVAMDRVLKEEEYARSRQHYSRLHAREKLRMESIEARDSSEARFTLPLTVDVLGPHKTLCQQLNPFGVEEGTQENHEFISAVKPMEEDDYDVYSSGSFGSSSLSSHFTVGSQAFSLGETQSGSSPPSRGAAPSAAPFGAVPVTESALSPAENGLLELLLLALVDNSNWGNPNRPFAPKLPSIVYPTGDVEGTAKRLSQVHLKNAVRCTDLVNLLDLQVGLEACVGFHGVTTPPARTVAAPNGCRLLPLTFTESDELGLRGMSRCRIDTLPLVLCITMNRPVDAGGPFQCSVGMDLLELFRQLPVVVAENFVRFRGGGSSQNPHYRVNIPQWCKAVWRRVIIEVQRAAVEAYLQATRSYAFDPFAVDAGQPPAGGITECALDAFEIDWQYCLQLSRWRVESLKRLADAHWKDDMQPITVTTPMRGTMEAALANSSLTQPPPEAKKANPTTPSTTPPPPTTTTTTSASRRTSTSVSEMHTSQTGPATTTTTTTTAASATGPPMVGEIPYAPGPRVYYVFDMQNLYVTASLALDQCNFMLFPRAEQLAHQFRQLEDQLRAETHKGSKGGGGGADVSPRSSMEPGGGWRSREATPMLSRAPSQSLELRIEALPGAEKPRLGLATALKQWSGVHKVLDTETAYSLCLNTIHSHEVSIVNFNGHVTQYNAYRSKESLIWGPIYKSGLRLAYALCIYLEVRPFDAMPEKLVSFLHPIAQFSGCSGGYREMKANLKEVKISIAERCRRAAVAVEIMTIETAEQLLEAAMAALDFCRNASDIVSCQATEDDVLTTSLRPVALPEKNFMDVPLLTMFSDL